VRNCGGDGGEERQIIASKTRQRREVIEFFHPSVKCKIKLFTNPMEPAARRSEKIEITLSEI
jgi:hypothetical protein